MCCCSSPDPQSQITASPAQLHDGRKQPKQDTPPLSAQDSLWETRLFMHIFNALFIKNISSSLNFRIYWRSANRWTNIYQRFHSLLLLVLFWGKYLSYLPVSIVSMQIQIYCKLFFQRTVSVINTHRIKMWHQPLTAEQMRWIPEVHALYATDEQMGVNPDTLPEKAGAK